MSAPADSRVVRATRRALRLYARTPALRRTPPRVTIVLRSGYGMGGTIRSAYNIAGWVARSHPVELLSLVRRRDEPFFELPPGVAVSALHDRRPEARRDGPIARRLAERPSVLLHPDEHVGDDSSLLTDLRLVRRLRRSSGWIIGTRPGLNVLLAELTPARVTTIGHEQLHLRAHPPSLRRAIRRAYPGLDAVVVLTERDRRRYARLVGTGTRVVRIPNSVRPLGGGPPDLDARTIIAAGRLTNQKGFDLLIRAFARIAGDFPEWTLRICGEGRKRGRLERMIARRGLEGRVELPGAVDDLGTEMERAALFVLSSRLEGFPLVLLEAMSKGLPVVSFACPTGPRDVIADRRDGRLVRPEKVAALGRAMAEVMRDPQLRRRLGAAARETAEAYRIEAVGPQWDRLLAETRGR